MRTEIVSASVPRIAASSSATCTRYSGRFGPSDTGIDSSVYAQDQDVSRGLLLQYRNSGDDYPERWGNWVVGYGAVAFCGDSG